MINQGSTTNDAYRILMINQYLNSLGTNDIQNIRILKRDLIYVTGLPAEISNSKLLKSSQFFGQYGKIKGIYVSDTNHQDS